MKTGTRTKTKKNKNTGERGFTIVEVIIAASIMIVLSVGILTVFSNVVQRNRGENIRMQAQSVLQKEVERYRSLKFIPIGSDAALNGTARSKVGEVTAESGGTGAGKVFEIFVTIDNDPSTSAIDTGSESTCVFKELTIEAIPKVADQGWLANLRTNVTIQRVRSN